MKERPILFSGPMVLAILDGRKTMTRRVVKPQPAKSCNVASETACDLLARGCPYGAPGDRLWVRETFALMEQRMSPPEMQGGVLFRASWTYLNTEPIWRPSIFMPRWASRINLEITGVRVERLQDISEQDAISEGVTVTWYGDNGPEDFDHIKPFTQLWSKINGQASWDANPFVWVVEFRRVE